VAFSLSIFKVIYLIKVNLMFNKLPLIKNQEYHLKNISENKYFACA
jgi:hypothetical protein